MRYYWSEHRVALADLIAFAWSAPMRDLAKQVGLSDVGLKKILKSHGVVLPPQGHWNRVRAGRPVPAPPSAPARGPGEKPYIEDRRFAHIPEAPLPSSAGPFASAKVPEDLEDLRTREAKAIGKAASASRLGTVHPEIQVLIDRDEKEIAKNASSRWPLPPILLFESPYEKRRLRILNAIFLTMGRRGYQPYAHIHDYQVEASVAVGDMNVSLHLAEMAKKVRPSSRYHAPVIDPKRPSAVKLELCAGRERWTDDASGNLEARIAEICAGVVVEGERRYRTRLRELEEDAEQRRIEAEEARQERLRQANADRLAALHESGKLLEQATRLRALIADVARSVDAGRVNLSPAELAAWREWAEQEADRIDPVMSGQVNAHLLPPSLE